MTIINTIMASRRTVFTMQSLLMLLDISQTNGLPAKLHYYVKQGILLNPRRGIYAKPEYDLREMACAVFQPSYISMEYVLCRSGVTFQYVDEITSISYQNRSLEIDGKIYSFRRINPLVWLNTAGIIQEDNIAIASPERAFLDMLYLSAGNCYFDNLRVLDKTAIRKILPTYNSVTLNNRVKQLMGI